MMNPPNAGLKWDATDLRGASDLFRLRVGSHHQSTGAALYTLAVLLWVSTPGFSATLPPPESARLSNVAVRGYIDNESNHLLTAFRIRGEQRKNLLLRGSGPALQSFGLTGVLPNPQLQLHVTDGPALAEVRRWDPNLASLFSQVGAFPFAVDSVDSALLSTLPSGAYTSRLRDANGGGGIAVHEVYDVDRSNIDSRVVTLFARAKVQGGEKDLFVGFTVQGQGEIQLLLRAVGFGLSSFAIDNALRRAELQVFDSRGQVMARGANDDADPWMKEVMARVGAFELPGSSADDAILLNLPAGSYTARVSGSGTSTGMAVADIYQVYPPIERPTLPVQVQFRPGQTIVFSGMKIHLAHSTFYLNDAGNLEMQWSDGATQTFTDADPEPCVNNVCVADFTRDGIIELWHSGWWYYHSDAGGPRSSLVLSENAPHVRIIDEDRKILWSR